MYVRKFEQGLVANKYQLLYPDKIKTSMLYGQDIRDKVESELVKNVVICGGQKEEGKIKSKIYINIYIY